MSEGAMEAREWHTVDKSEWGEGPWQSEPDKRQWRDEETGLPCLIVRGPHGGLCGYVGVSEGHPWFGKSYHDCVEPSRHERHENDENEWHHNCTPEGMIEVHGGLTYSDFCQADTPPEKGICHVPNPGEPDHVYWFGFDCAHSGDYSPKYDHRYKQCDGVNGYPEWPADTYKTLAYVADECASLAKQLIAKPHPDSEARE